MYSPDRLGRKPAQTMIRMPPITTLGGTMTLVRMDGSRPLAAAHRTIAGLRVLALRGQSPRLLGGGKRCSNAVRQDGCARVFAELYNLDGANEGFRR